MANERITENIVRAAFSNAEGFIVEEQKSQNPRINKLLQCASKSGSGVGRPEFIISSTSQPELLFVVECKPDITKHQSKDLNQYNDYAVDGALLYSSYLSKEYDVIALGVSGQNEKELKATSYLQLKSTPSAQPFAENLLALMDFQEKYIHDDSTKLQRYEKLLEYNKELNVLLHNKKIQEDKRSLLISGILIALEYNIFKETFSKYETAKEIADELVNSISRQLHKANLEYTRIGALEGAYSFIRTHKSFSEDRDFLIDLIRTVDEKINSFVKTYKYYDIFGEFYIEFLRYANNDKGLGIVLTPKHITDLFVELANVNKDSIVLDNCCGTGGFLISSMRKMIKDADHDSAIEEKIKKEQIVGVEYQDTIFPLACSNMIIHGDGKTNIFNESCFKKDLIESLREKFKANVGFLNPPYKVKRDDIEEFEFVLNCLGGLEKNGICIALVPIQCALAQSGTRKELKRRLLRNHQLEAVMTLPHDIFYNSNVGVVTCAMIIRAHQPHTEGYETYFGHWKNDGFIKHKSKGRIDGGEWDKIRQVWINSYRNKKSVINLSVLQYVTAKDEWCAEAYMETDYTKLSRDNFIEEIHDYAVYQFKNKRTEFATSDSITNANLNFDVSNWKYFDYDKENGIFEIVGGYYNKKPIDREDGEVPFIGASALNYGITSWHYKDDLDEKGIFDPNWIGVTNNGSAGCAYYIDQTFTCSHDVNLLRLRDHKLNIYIAMFLCAVIEMEKFRWDYGRKWRPMRMKHSIILLPSDSNGMPDWRFMEKYIKSLPYSKNLEKISTKGLTDVELIEKYESGEIDMGKKLKQSLGD